MMEQIVGKAIVLTNDKCFEGGLHLLTRLKTKESVHNLSMLRTFNVVV
jgi:hypothetical protein